MCGGIGPISNYDFYRLSNGPYEQRDDEWEEEEGDDDDRWDDEDWDDDD